LDPFASVIIIPAYNEENRIEKTFRSIRETFHDSKIVVVMDGCTDKTYEIVSGLADQRVILLVYERRLGKGGAIMQGLKNGNGSVIALLDADGATSPRELQKLIREVGQYDLVFGSRYLKDSKILANEPLSRVFLSRIFNALIKIMFWSMKGIMDTQCGAKVFKGSIIEKIKKDLFITDFAFDVNFIYSALRHGFRVKELGITWKHVEDNSKVSTDSFKLSLKMFLSLIRLRLYYSKFKGIIDTKLAKLIHYFYERL